MILLTSTSDLVKLVLGTTGTVSVTAHAVDIDESGNSAQVPKSYRLIQNLTTGTNTIVAAPSGTYKRLVKTITILNTHASASNLVTVEQYDGSSTVPLYAYTLLAGELLQYSENEGWSCLDANGNEKFASTTPGRYLGLTLLTSASGNFTTGPSTTEIEIDGVGSGGAGGGCTSVSSAAGAGGGGGAGSECLKRIAVSPNTAYAYTCGAAATGSSGAAGPDGSDSTFVVGATTYTAKKGSGGPQAVSATTLKTFLGGAGGAVATNGDVNGIGEDGFPGFTLIVATPIGLGGAGGSSRFGSGGRAAIAAGAGNNATGFGAGGGGALTGASSARAGGNSTAGCWLVKEFS